MDDYSDDESISTFYRMMSQEKTKELQDRFPGLGKFSIRSYESYDALYGPIFYARYCNYDSIRQNMAIIGKNLVQERALSTMISSIIRAGVDAYRSVFPKEVLIVISDLPEGVIIANPKTLKGIVEREEYCRVYRGEKL